MNEKIFRKKNLDIVKSPESLDDYIQVSNPGVWLLLVSIIILLAGVFVWGVFGHIDSSVEASVCADEKSIVCCAANCEYPVESGMKVLFGEYEGEIIRVEQKDGEYICTLKSNQAVPFGTYDGKIIVKSFKPLSFILDRGN